MSFKSKIKKLVFYLEYKTGLRSTIPGIVINAVPVHENNEPLVDIKKAGVVLFFGERLKGEQSVFLRKSAAEKLIKAAGSLPEGVFMIVYDAFRSLEIQRKHWNEKYKYFKELYPDESDEVITKRTRALVANPYTGSYGGHQTGGAVDVGLCDKNGIELDMGTPYVGTGRETRTDFKFNDEVVNRNRKLLLAVMQKQGFVNYPNEWWHFCYGDRMWAPYSNKSSCFYGLVEEI